MFRKIIALSVSAALVGTSTTTSAAGFALIELNASGMGNAYAGQAASAQDASTIFFNPAGMTQLPGRQVVGAIHAISPQANFNNAGTTTLAPLQTRLGSNGGDAGGLAFVPNMYLSWQLTPRVFVGAGVNVPFGLKTDYSPEWMGRFHGITSEVRTINVNPSIAFKVSDALSLGFGINYQRVEATLTNAVNYSAAAFGAGGAPLLTAIGGAGVEGIGKVEGDDSSWGYNLGAMINLSQATRLGLSYRSAIKHKLEGTTVFSGRPAALAAGIPDGLVTADVKLPDSASVSLFHKANAKWDILADASWTGWSSIKALNIVRTNGVLLASTPLDYKDSWRLSLGANYHMNDRWTLRGGVAYDQTPVPDLDRTVRIPDGNRTWLAVGGQYRLSKATAIDFGFAHLFVPSDPTVDSCSPAQAAANPAIVCAGKNRITGSYSGIFQASCRLNGCGQAAFFGFSG